MAAIMVSACDGLSAGSAELAEKGYATQAGRIVRVAEPSGPVIALSEKFTPGKYVLQGYDAAMAPEFTDILTVDKSDTPKTLLSKALLTQLQGRMKLDHGGPSYKTSDYPCAVNSLTHRADGTFSGSGTCRIISRRIVQKFSYSGQSHADGFTIDVVRATTGDTPEAGEAQMRILAHIKMSDEPA
ncbi:MAG: hypothetical protein NBV68_02550 [Erythrobacter sp.]|uniref:hypothetical protein n=1 Tax=Erythrobacter sp. TaxID=1042 RepID=UPI0025FA14BC|nr:hypothetical protein [Erythrobacter sp.]MCL9998237.1 hypothetical protein [Erythrobacter sp.]